MRSSSYRILLLALCCFAPAAVGQVAPAAEAPFFTTNPDDVLLAVEDIRRLADVVRSFDGATVDTSAVIDASYLGHASPGLRAYAARYNVTGASIASAMRSHPAAYADLDGLACDIDERGPELRSAFTKLHSLIPDAVYPTIWFVVGHNGPGGLARQEGVLIAAERLVKQPDLLVPLVVHELVHIQQAIVQGVETYRRIYEGNAGTLLALAIREGSADFVADLATGQRINPAAEEYGLAHEAELWDEFRADMHGTDTGPWMFARPAGSGRPSDLGYWIGSRIAESYYDNADDKSQAIRELLAVTDFEAFLEASRYEEALQER